MTTQGWQPPQSRVCASQNPIAYIIRKWLCSVLKQSQLSQTIIPWETNFPNKSLHSGSRRENNEHCLSYRTSVTFLTEYNITVSFDVFVSVLLVEQEIAFIHDAVFFFFLHVCVLCVSTGVFRG